MAEYIEREALIEYIKIALNDRDRALMQRIIDKQPAADVVEVRHGEWVLKKEWRKGGWVKWFECSCCGEVDNNYDMYDAMPWNELPNYCPNCGAKMDGKGDGE